DLGAVQLAAVLAAEDCDVTLLDAYALTGSTLAWRPDGRAHLGAPLADVLARATAAPHDLAVVAYTPFHRPPRRDDLLGDLLAGPTPPLVTSRGCPFTCVHCSSNPGLPEGAPKTQRRLSPERLRHLAALLVRRHGATRLAVLDEMLNVNARHFDAFLDAACDL